MSSRSMHRVTDAELRALATIHNRPISHDGAGERSLWIDGVLYVTTDEEHTR